MVERPPDITGMELILYYLIAMYGNELLKHPKKHATNIPRTYATTDNSVRSDSEIFTLFTF